tara:strand:- start:25620 stop:26012 length:393 start_codon:yes stop_codon:yes gene_type:complete
MHRYRDTILRFALVGGLVAASYVLLYLTFLAIGLTQVVANAAAFLLAVVLQYAGQAAFTFERRLLDRAQMLRFAVMIGLGFVTSAVITGVIAPEIGLAPWAAATAVTILLPVQNYVFMTLWVFAAPRAQG